MGDFHTWMELIRKRRQERRDREARRSWVVAYVVHAMLSGQEAFHVR